MRKKGLLLLIILFCLIFLLSFKSIAFTQSLQKATEHFNFYSKDNSNMDIINKIAETMEYSYDRVTDDVGYKLDTKLDVYIYNSPADLQKALNSNSEWLKDTFRNNKVYLSLHKDVLKSSVHEFTHAVIHTNKNRKANSPRWLNEGLAQYEAGQQPNDEFKKIVTNNINNNSVPGFFQLDTDSNSFAQEYGYQYSYLIIKFLIEEHGKENMQQLIRNFNDFEKIYNMSFDQCYSEWVNYLKTQYL